MESINLFKLYPKLEEKQPRVCLINKPTDFYCLTKIQSQWMSRGLFIKREDQTAKIYGGNKVRNLEFVLGEAKSKQAQNLVTLVPYGSNFTAALSAHARLNGFQVDLCQFIMETNLQIEAHAEFSKNQGAHLLTYKNKLGPILAASHGLYRKYLSQHQGQSYWISPGASSATGALGHVNAALEAISQWKEMGIKTPDYLIVGAGTCGTIAGLSVGLQLAGLSTKVIGVRCAEPLVCNPFRIANLGRAILKKLQSEQKFDSSRIILTESPDNRGYAVPTPSAQKVAREFEDMEGIELDSTYTAKVVSFIKDRLINDDFRGNQIVYWHTYSSAALDWKRTNFNKNISTLSEVTFKQEKENVSELF